MTDARELILARLVQIAEGIEGIKTVSRNPAPGLSEHMRPAILIYDGDEETVADERPGRRPPTVPKLVSMTPEVYIQLGDLPEDVGTSLNVFRAKYIKAVLTDIDMIALLGSNGGMSYEGCSTALSRGRRVEGEVNPVFTFLYVLEPAKLVD